MLWTYEEAALSKDEALKYLVEQNATLGNNTPTISECYEPGDYITVDGKLYKVLLPILAGGQITPGTNVELTTLVVEISNFNKEET